MPSPFDTDPGLLALAARFPAGFHLGASTSAFQIEGATRSDGRGRSWWDDFCDQPGRIADGSHGDVACDHFRRWREDLDLIASLGHNAYRFSVAWPRVLPQGRGAVNSAGLDHYERLVDGLLERGIAPYLTLYHWDLPSPLAKAGGWQVRDTASAFAEFADVVARRLGDRVHSYATLNEPRCAAFVGHLEGRHAPGWQDGAAAVRAAHHLLLAHGLAMPALRANTRQARCGIVLDVKPYDPADLNSAADVAAAHAGDGVFNRWFLDPIFRGHYPQDVWDGFGPWAPEVHAGDMAAIAAPIDTLGINYYTRAVVSAVPGEVYPGLVEVRVPGQHYSHMGWEDHPDGLRRMLRRLHEDYRVPDLFIAENGAAEPDVLSPEGRVDDPARLRYLQGHLAVVAEAIEAGVPLSAHLVWSLMDNFEWGRGYVPRFGLLYVDYANGQRRILKRSGAWHSALAKAALTGGAARF